MYPRSRAFELRTPQAPWRSEWAAEHAAPGTCVRFSEQVAKLKAQATGLDWPYKVGVWVCAGAGSCWQRCCAGPPALPLPRRSQGPPLAGYFSAACASGFHGTKVPSAARTDKHGRAFLGEKNSPVFLLWLSEAWNKSRTKMFIPVCEEFISAWAAFLALYGHLWVSVKSVTLYL